MTAGVEELVAAPSIGVDVTTASHLFAANPTTVVARRSSYVNDVPMFNYYYAKKRPRFILHTTVVMVFDMHRNVKKLYVSIKRKNI